MDLKVRRERAVEEIELTKQEMMTMLEHLSAKHKYLTNIASDNDKCFSVVLLEKADGIKSAYIKSRSLFSKFIPNLPTHIQADAVFTLTDEALQEQLAVLDIEEGEIDEETLHYNWSNTTLY